jgi:hypothetical protein
MIRRSSRLKYDKPAFKSLGFSDYEIETLEKQVTSESPKCLTMTVTDGNNGIVTTVILLSERFNSCLVSGMLSSFGIAASDISAETLIDVCVLYEDVGAVYGIAKALLGKILNSATFA